MTITAMHRADLEPSFVSAQTYVHSVILDV